MDLTILSKLTPCITLLPVFPLLGFLVISLTGKKLGHNVAGWLASFCILASFGCAAYLFAHISAGDQLVVNLFDWIKTGSISVGFSFLVDPLTVIFLLIITGIGFLIHIYSISYMHGDEGFNRFFAYLNLFVFFMLLLVMGSNYIITFIGWEGVGLCSYLLIGFWYKNQEYNNAAKKAFIMNRIGDLGFLLGIFFLLFYFGTADYQGVAAAVSGETTNSVLIVTIALLLFIGATGKSAQIPLYTWLPDAMAGPTPVSALIHAATMVTAGIYMIARSNALFIMAPMASEIILVVGTFTALLAGIIGLKQTDIKKVLAYSTVSQLGFMFAAIGVGAYSTAVFHVFTHAFFKALLFLGSGSVIHAMSGEQDIRHMGGLKKYLPVTHLTFLIGTLAITGAPLLAGFYSKDEILAGVYGHSPLFFGILALCSILTSIYMFRLYFLTFGGTFRGTEEQKHHLHESPALITVPLIVLAICSVLAGYVGLPELFHAPHLLNAYLGQVIAIPVHHVSHTFEYVMMGGFTIALAVIIFWAYNTYVKKKQLPAASEAEMSGLSRAIYNKFYVDEFYRSVFVKPVMRLSDSILVFVEKIVIDGAVNITAWITQVVGNGVKLVQTGSTGFYIFAMVIAVAVILISGIL